MKIFSFVFLILIAQSSIAFLDVSGFNDDQICVFAKDSPIPAQITYEINARDIECHDGVVIYASKALTSKGSVRLIRLKR